MVGDLRGERPRIPLVVDAAHPLGEERARGLALGRVGEADAERILKHLLGAGVHHGADAHSLTARVDGDGRVAEALGALASAGIVVAELTLGQPSLDDVFFALTGKPAEAPADAAPAQGGTLPGAPTREEARA